jgi:hypothetical protein
VSDDAADFWSFRAFFEEFVYTTGGGRCVEQSADLLMGPVKVALSRANIKMVLVPMLETEQYSDGVVRKVKATI